MSRERLTREKKKKLEITCSSKLAIPSSRLAPKRRLGGEFEADRSSQLTTHYFMTGDDLRSNLASMNNRYYT